MAKGQAPIAGWPNADVGGLGAGRMPELRRIVALCVMLLFCGRWGWAAPVLGYRVVARLPHSTASFTEGFFYRDGLFYEGSGLEGKSALVVSVPATGRVVRQVALAPEYFGEGIVDWGPYVYEWTWTSHVGFVYDRRTLKPVRQFTYDGEGWGMTRTTKEIVTSDGSVNLTFRDPLTFKPVRTIAVHDGPKLIDQVNELEFIKGEIWANVWHQERLLRISPKDGQVLAYVDLHGLRPVETMGNPEAVLNGIAYDAARDRVYVTGKQWPAVFEIRVVAATADRPSGKTSNLPKTR